MTNLHVLPIPHQVQVLVSVTVSESPTHVGASLRPTSETLLVMDDERGSVRRVDEG